MEGIFAILPNHITTEIQKYLHKEVFPVQEIRLRINRPVEINDGKNVKLFYHLTFTTHDAKYLLNNISEYSLYRLEEELKQGFITVNGGHRIGIAGSVNLSNGTVKAIQHISSFNIRIATNLIGVSEAYIQDLYNERYVNTLIIGPPQSGKTTFLRDLTRVISNGYKAIPAMKTAVVDERSEICGSVNGVPQSISGGRIDVLDRCPKTDGMMMLVRSMSPQVIIVDEIGTEEDVQAIDEVMHAGITLICSIHGYSFEDVINRETIKPLIEKRVFERLIVLSNDRSTGEITAIYDKDGKKVHAKSVSMI
jgi:stage III sporulation protein AA